MPSAARTTLAFVQSALRTLVVSPDAAYRARAHPVLGPAGPVVLADAAPREPAAVARLVDEQRADVVVLDATGCEATTRAVIATLAQTAPRAGIVVVSEHCTEPARALGALPKWGWAKDLLAAVESARRDGNPLCPAALRSLRGARPRRRGPSAAAMR